jgi:hypothetical protein
LEGVNGVQRGCKCVCSVEQAHGGGGKSMQETLRRGDGGESMKQTHSGGGGGANKQQPHDGGGESM